ncbi:hypothetical protein BGZ94_009349 [Podila epigama]|nr:hypothetical protein BGZ94_009349 [Podila epigama]
MGALISKFRQTNESDYEKILSDLDNNIRKAELRLSAIKLREKRFTGLWLLYSMLAWIGYAAVFLFYLHHEYHDIPQTWALAFAPIVFGLPLIYFGRSAINVWFKRAQTNEESELNLLRADQRLKVEELKKRTAYYSTKTLLERYDPSSQQQRVNNGGRSARPDNKPLNRPQNGQQGVMPPGNIADPGLRQRTGLGVSNAHGGVPPGMRPSGLDQRSGQGVGPNMGISTGMQPPMGHALGPRGPQGPFVQGPNAPYPPPQQHQGHIGQNPYGSPNMEKHWYDKIVDVIVGDEGPDTKYALICGQCYAHNGLALPQEIETIRHDSSLLQVAQQRPLPASRDPSPSPAHRSPVVPDHDARSSVEHSGHGVGSPVDVQQELEANGSSSERSEEHSENSIEFVNNWNDSDVEHPGKTDEDDVDIAGYNVESAAVESDDFDSQKKRGAGKGTEKSSEKAKKQTKTKTSSAKKGRAKVA